MTGSSMSLEFGHPVLDIWAGCWSIRVSTWQRIGSQAFGITKFCRLRHYLGLLWWSLSPGSLGGPVTMGNMCIHQWRKMSWSCLRIWELVLSQKLVLGFYIILFFSWNCMWIDGVFLKLCVRDVMYLKFAYELLSVLFLI